ncbi:hypothetical protein [Paenibacillus spiritus]|uniref:hypothetical protein n=1 Tax=Paenibacillus spiritus TaxID=2496557 RepID=UPI00168B383D|nr:hypothetical protein [Paenibacillus spiritus]
MEYGLLVTTKDTKKLDKAGIEWTYWDIETVLFEGVSGLFKIIFDSESERNKAKQILKK